MAKAAERHFVGGGRAARLAQWMGQATASQRTRPPAVRARSIQVRVSRTAKVNCTKRKGSSRCIQSSCWPPCRRRRAPTDLNHVRERYLQRRASLHLCGSNRCRSRLRDGNRPRVRLHGPPPLDARLPVAYAPAPVAYAPVSCCVRPGSRRHGLSVAKTAPSISWLPVVQPRSTAPAVLTPSAIPVVSYSGPRIGSWSFYAAPRWPRRTQTATRATLADRSGVSEQ